MLHKMQLKKLHSSAQKKKKLVRQISKAAKREKN